MGGDGGVKATNRKFMRGYKDSSKANETKDVNAEKRLLASSCALTSKKFTIYTPIVACELGHLFNKEDILTALIDKTLPEAFSHIRGLKDLKTLQFTNNPHYTDHHNSTNNGENSSLFICPITGDEFNGIIPFCVIWSTGYVLSERAIREMGIERLQAEYGPFRPLDIIRLIAVLPEEIELLRSNMNIRHAERVNKKESKRKRDHTTTTIDPTDYNNTLQLTSTTSNTHIPPTTNHLTSSTTTSFTTSTAHKISKSSSVVKSVHEQIQQQNESSKVYSNLFHTDKEVKEKMNDRDLFISVAGLRYTIS